MSLSNLQFHVAEKGSGGAHSGGDSETAEREAKVLHCKYYLVMYIIMHLAVLHCTLYINGDSAEVLVDITPIFLLRVRLQ